MIETLLQPADCLFLFVDYRVLSVSLHDNAQL
jgi:hypothetical protein